MYRIYHLLLVLIFGYALAQDDLGDFLVSFEDSSSEVHLEIARMYQDNGFFEATASSLNEVIALPRDIGIVSGQCDTVNAFWSPDYDAIIMCYELTEYLYETFRAETKSQQELDNAVLGAVEFIFYHELGHALIDLFGIPFTGREEDAVDQFSTYVLLGSDLGVESALSGASFFFISGNTGPEVQNMEDLAFWDEHSLDQQRFYNIVCMIYGSDPETYANLIRQESKGFLLTSATGYLPKERAERCPDEYYDISRSWETLLNTYVAFNELSEPEVTSTPQPAKTYAESFTGTLEQGDKVYDTEEFFDEYTVDLVAGQEVSLELTSYDFGTYILVRTADGAVFWKTDSGELTDSGSSSTIILPVPTTGTWTIEVSSYNVGETGAYLLGINTQDDVYQTIANDVIVETDTAFTETGEYYHVYEYDFTEGEHVVFALTSQEFDTFLYAMTPSGEYFVNDDYENQTYASRIEFDVPETGLYEIYVTTHDVGEVGNYEMVLGRTEPAVVPQAEPEQTGQTEASTGDPSYDVTDMTTSKARSTNLGILEAGDETLDTGEFVDFYSIDLEQGQPVKFTLISADFSTYLAVMDPAGTFFENDELAEDINKSQITFNAADGGTWLVFVTTDSPGQSGNYMLTIKK
ncbi:MAG: hypothetical protein KC422_15755 [Trueperaceae bacterium]|nr:hypothetical protein [Trueperaceae bacterium]